MKFILPTGESHKLTVEFIASTFNINYSEATEKKRLFENLLKNKSKNQNILKPKYLYSEVSEEINFACLAMVIINNKAMYETPVWSSYDFPEKAHAAEKKVDSCIEDLLFLLYKSFSNYFDNEIKPSAHVLSTYLEVPVNYGLLDEEGEALVQKSKWHNKDVELDHLRLSFSVDEDFMEANDETRRKKSTDIRNKLAKIGTLSYIETDCYEFIIPWFYVPILNKNLNKLGYGLGVAKNKKEKSTSIDSFIDDIKNIKSTKSIEKPTYIYSYSLFFPKMEHTSPEVQSYQTILDQFAFIGFFNGYENKLKISDALNIIGKTSIEFSSDISFEKVEKIAEELRSAGLKCEANSLFGLSNSIEVPLMVNELEGWVKDKVAAKYKQLVSM